jgi:4'-phosphopantetheinyl transferase
MNQEQPTSSPACWSFPLDDLSLVGGEVHVWRIRLELLNSREEDWLQTLEPDERARAGRFHFARDRRRFIVGRASLRAILARYLGRKPEELRFLYSRYGKPALADEFREPGINFNLSHSQELALLGVRLHREIGIDIESLSADVSCEEIAERFFSAQEAGQLLSLPAELRKKAFFDCWTRKEAYIKARGEGLFHRLDQFDVSLAPGEKAALLSTRDDPAEANNWSLLELYPDDGYTAALATRGPILALKCFIW